MPTDNLVSLIVTLLGNNWTNANTGNVTPAIKNISDVKRSGGDSVFVYSISETVEDNASGASAKKKIKTIAIDCRSYTNYAQGILIKEEVERILNANQVDPFSDQVYDISDIEDVDDMSENTRGLFRFKILIQFEQFNISI